MITQRKKKKKGGGGACTLWPSAGQSSKGLRGRRISTPFSLGGCCDYSVGPTLKPYRQTPPFCGSDWLGDPKRARGQAKLCESGEQVLSGIGQLLFYQLHPPPPPPPLAPQSHCTYSQATCSCRFNMTARPLIDSWSTGSCSSRAPALAMLSLIGSLAYLVQAPAPVCRPRANLTALSCTRSPFPYRAALANRISTGHWMEQEIKEDPKK